MTDTPSMPLSVYPLCSSPLPHPLHIASSAGTVPPKIRDPHVLILISFKVLFSLQFHDIPSVCVTDQFCFWLLSLLMLAGQLLWLCGVFSIIFFFLLTEKIKFLILRVSLPISTKDHFGSDQDLPYYVIVKFVPL